MLRPAEDCLEPQTRCVGLVLWFSEPVDDHFGVSADESSKHKKAMLVYIVYEKRGAPRRMSEIWQFPSP